MNHEALIQYLDAYKRYIDAQKRSERARPLANTQEDYKRGVARKAAEVLDVETWAEGDIGKGTIGARAIKAVQRNQNLIGRFQVSVFADKVKENYTVSERVLFDLFHERKDKECFERICRLFGRKYDLVAYLYYVADPDKYLPLRSSIFDGIFKKLGINLQTTGLCSWKNYQEYLSTIASVRDVIKDHFQMEDVDLLDAHSFLWTTNLDVLEPYFETAQVIAENSDTAEAPPKEKKTEVGANVFHKDYANGTITKMTDAKIYIDFAGRLRVFSYPEAFEKEYLILI